MKQYLLMASLLFAVSTTWAAIVTDDFNRADTISSTDTSLIGANWAQSVGSPNRWRIASGTVVPLNTSTPAIMYNTALETLGGGVSGGATNSFVLSLDVAMETNNVWAGVVFNYQDENNFYCLRIKSDSTQYQVLSSIGGALSVLASGNATVTFAYGSDTFYQLTVSSDFSYGFNVKVREAAGGMVIAQAEALDGGENFSGGYAGLYLAALIPGEEGLHELAKWDNFNLETSVYGDIALDYFNRANTAQTGFTVNVGGSGWTQSGDGLTPASDWFVNDNVLRLRNRDDFAILYNSDLQMQSGSDTNFTLSADVYAREADIWTGVVFNYQDMDNYYVLRIKADATDYQLLQRNAGVWDVLESADLSSGTFAQDTYYTMTIVSDSAGVFDFTITEQGDSSVLNAVTNHDDSASALTGGYAGLFGETTLRTHIAHFDDFRLTVSGAVLTGYAGWAAGWVDDIGAEGADFDNDGLNNLYEYGLGGDPTNALDQGTSPEFAVVDDGGSDVLRYIYPQLSDPQSGLSYSLELNTDLLATGSWVDAGYTVDGTNVTGGTLNFVTNTADTVASEKFIRLIIQ